MAAQGVSRSARELVELIKAGTLNKDEGISALISHLFDVNWRTDTRRAAAEGLSQLGYDFGAIVVAALGTTATEGDATARNRLAHLSTDALGAWLFASLSSNATYFVGQGITTARYSFHWTHAIRAAGWVKRTELIHPLVQQLMVDEIGREQVEEVGRALAMYGDLAVDALTPLLGMAKLVWTRPASHKEPLAARAFAVLEGEHLDILPGVPHALQSYKPVRDFDTPKAIKALKQAKGWWNMRRFDSDFRNTIKNRK